MLLKSLRHSSAFLFFVLFLASSCKTHKKSFRNAYHFSKHKYYLPRPDSLKNAERKEDSLAMVRGSTSLHASSKAGNATPMPTERPMNRALPLQRTENKVQSTSDSTSLSTEIKMKNLQKKDKQPSGKKKRRLAILIGASILLIGILAGITVPALSSLFVLNNVALTASNVISNFGQFSAAVVGWISIFVLDLLASFGIYKYNKEEKPKMAALTGGLRLAYTGILGIGISELLKVSTTIPAASIYQHIDKFNSMWGLGLIFFGFHLLTLGILFKNEGGKKWVNTAIKTLLIVAGIGYIIQYVGILLVPNPVTFAAFVEPIFIIPMILGEVFYALWTLFKGGKKPKG